MYLTGADDGRRCGDSDDDGEKVTIISDVRWWLLEGFITLVVGSLSNWLLHVSHSDARLFRWNVWGRGALLSDHGIDPTTTPSSPQI